ncbi:bifunctional glycosyltransferase family 2/GtrA family protein [Galactobacter sp.]|uniref:bifunctional glycosyltransferase family 2/GtrA family protein n=1 Tax=Galactobacter sp. TaxID=2676125 RepID=UPI0025BB9AE3|nr:bifunctional glycosyltransferase family 2/GtrA family protein [Galactobacter sp.]
MTNSPAHRPPDSPQPDNSLSETTDPRAMGRPAVQVAPGEPIVDVVIPVYNEETDLAGCIRTLDDYLAGLYPADGPGYSITIADNASTDQTPQIGAALADDLTHVRYLRLEEKGRGRALRRAWLTSQAPVLAYMDVDLSTGLSAFPALVAPLISGHSDVAIGSRLAAGAAILRGPKRDFISRCYNLLLKGCVGAGFSDAQCGFKAIRKDVAERLIPVVADEAWFFDTEMLILAEQAGLRISEVSVDWVDDPNSTVHVADTAFKDLQGVWRVGTGLLRGRIPLAAVREELGRETQTARPRGFWGHLVRFGAVGIGTTILQMVLFVLLGFVMGAQVANVVSLLLATVANTAFNRSFTFGVRGRAGMVTHHLQGLTVFFLGWGLSAGSLAMAHAAGASRTGEVIAVVGGNLVATLVKFVLFRTWVFRDQVSPKLRATTADSQPDQDQRFPTSGNPVTAGVPTVPRSSASLRETNPPLQQTNPSLQETSQEQSR